MIATLKIWREVSQIDPKLIAFFLISWANFITLAILNYLLLRIFVHWNFFIESKLNDLMAFLISSL